MKQVATRAWQALPAAQYSVTGPARKPQLTPAQRLEVEKASAVAVVRPALHRLPPGGPVRVLTAPPAMMRISRLHAIKAGPATRKAERNAAQMRALCAATHNAPAGLPAKCVQGHGAGSPLARKTTTIHAWTEEEIERVLKFLPKIANSRKTRYQKLRDKRQRGTQARRVLA